MNTAMINKAPAPKRLSTLRFYEGGFVLNTASGQFYRLTPPAEYLLRSLADGVEPEQLAALTQTRYGVDQKTAVRDVELLLNQLAALGLLDQPQER